MQAPQQHLSQTPFKSNQKQSKRQPLSVTENEATFCKHENSLSRQLKPGTCPLFPIPKSPRTLDIYSVEDNPPPASFVSDRECYAYIDIECSTQLGAPFCASAFTWTCLHLHSWLILSERWVCRVARGEFEQIINTSPRPQPLPTDTRRNIWERNHFRSIGGPCQEKLWDNVIDSYFVRVHFKYLRQSPEEHSNGNLS